MPGWTTEVFGVPRSRWKTVLFALSVVVLVFAVVLYSKIDGTQTQKWMMVGLGVATFGVVMLLARIHTTGWITAAVYGVVGIGVAAGVTSVVLQQAGFFGKAIPVGPRQVTGFVAGAAQGGATGGDSLSFSIPEDFNNPVFRGRFLNWVGNIITFDSVTHGQSDRNYLDRSGNRGLIVAANNIHNTPHGELGPGRGRVLWYVRTDSGYRAVGLPPGASYVFVDSFVPAAGKQDLDATMLNAYVSRAVVHGHYDKPLPAGDTARVRLARDAVRRAVVERYHGRPQPFEVSSQTIRDAGTDSTVLQEASDMGITGFARGIVIPADAALPVRVIRITVKRHYEYWWNRPVARWLGPGTYHPWGNCDTHGCCEAWQ